MYTLYVIWRYKPCAEQEEEEEEEESLFKNEEDFEGGGGGGKIIQGRTGVRRYSQCACFVLLAFRVIHGFTCSATSSACGMGVT